MNNLSELALAVACSNGSRELGHGVQLCWKVFEQGGHMGWQACPMSPVLHA